MDGSMNRAQARVGVLFLEGISRVGWGGLKNCPPDRPVAPSGQTRGFSSPQHWNNKRGSTVALNSFKLFLKKKYPLLVTYRHRACWFWKQALLCPCSLWVWVFVFCLRD